MKKLFLLISLCLIAPICSAASEPEIKKVTWKQKISEKYTQTKDFCKRNKKVGYAILLLSLCALPIVRPLLANNWHARIDRQLAHEIEAIQRVNNPQMGFENQLNQAEAQAQAEQARLRAERSHLWAAFWIGR